MRPRFKEAFKLGNTPLRVISTCATLVYPSACAWYRCRCSRLTNAGDTVVALPVGNNQCVKVALDRDRRVEAFTVSADEQTSVEQRLELAFSAAYKSGRFQASPWG